MTSRSRSRERSDRDSGGNPQSYKIEDNEASKSPQSTTTRSHTPEITKDEDREWSRSRSPADKRSRSPAKRSRSPAKRSRSPAKRSRSPAKRSYSRERGHSRDRNSDYSPPPPRDRGDRSDRRRYDEHGNDLHMPDYNDERIHSKIFIGNLAFKTNKRDLGEQFGKYGKIVDVHIPGDKYSGELRGFGFVTYDNEQSADEAIRKMNGADLHGRELRVNHALPRTSAGRSEGGSGGRSRSDRDRFSGGGGGYGRRERPSFRRNDRYRGGGGGRRDGGYRDNYRDDRRGGGGGGYRDNHRRDGGYRGGSDRGYGRSSGGYRGRRYD